MTAFGLETKTLRWDLTSVLVTGAYPDEEQAADYAQVGYGYSSGRQKQIRYLQVTTDDGAVPVWDAPYDGNTTDVATVIDTMHALREHAGCQDFVLIGDSKLLSETNRHALLTAEVGYLAPLAYVSDRERNLAPEEQTRYLGAERTVEVRVPGGQAGQERRAVRQLFVVSSEERAACRRNRARQRERAEAEILGVLGRVGSRWYPTAERATAKIEAILEHRHLSDLYTVSCAEQDGHPRLTCALIPAALARAEALDGYYVLETTRTPLEMDAAALVAEWKGQWQIEHRHRDAKGPLRIRPLFVTSNRRIVGLVTILGLALMVFSLIEREARRALAPDEKVPNLLAGHVAARPTGDNLFKALREIALVTFEIAGVRQQQVADLTPLQRTLLPLLRVPEAAYTRLNS